MINIEKIFIIHFEDLVERKKYLDSNILLYKLSYKYISSNNQKDQQILQSNALYKYNPNIYKRHLTKGEICVSIQHIHTYLNILQDNIRYALIIEDDAIFKDNFFDNLKMILSKLPSSFDICFVSECCNLHAAHNDSIVPNIYSSPTSRCVSGYIINSKSIPYILSTLPFQYPIDWHLNMINKNNELNFYWSEPCIVDQGSEFKYKSNLR